MSMPDRRQFLGCLGAGAVLRPQDPPPADNPASRTDLHALAELARRTPRRDLPKTCRQLHAQGVDWRDLLGAAFLAGIRDVQPRPVGFAFHCVLMTWSGYQIGFAVPPEDRLRVALYNLDDLKESQVREQRNGDWTLPPAPTVDAAIDAARAARDLAASLDGWHEDGADRAATALARCASLDEAFQPLWLRAGRDFTNIGHKAIFVVQAFRTLQQIGWRFGEEVLRSLAWGLLEGRPGAADQHFPPNRERAARLSWDGRRGRLSVALADDLCRHLRTADPDQAAEAVVAALRDGADLQAVHDGLRLWAMELLLRLPGIVGVHPLTVTSALLFAGNRVHEPTDRVTLTLQAASWLAAFRDVFAARSGYRQDAPGLVELQPADTLADAADVLRMEGRARGAALPLALASVQPDGGATFGQQVRHWLVRKVAEHHDYKFAAALLEEAALAQPAVGHRLLAAGTCFLRGPGDADHPVAGPDKT